MRAQKGRGRKGKVLCMLVCIILAMAGYTMMLVVMHGEAEAESKPKVIRRTEAGACFDFKGPRCCTANDNRDGMEGECVPMGNWNHDCEPLKWVSENRATFPGLAEATVGACVVEDSVVKTIWDWVKPWGDKPEVALVLEIHKGFLRIRHGKTT